MSGILDQLVLSSRVRGPAMDMSWQNSGKELKREQVVSERIQTKENIEKSEIKRKMEIRWNSCFK